MKNLRNITKIAATLAGVAMVAGCAKAYEEPAVDITVDDPVVAQPTTKTMTIRAGKPATGGDTRTVLDGTKVNWQQTDELGVFIDAMETKTGDPVKTANSEFSIPEDGLNTTTDIATFTGGFTPTAGIPEVVNYYAYYPYTEAADGSEYNAVPLTLPTTQKPKAGSFDPVADFLFGTATTTGVQIGKAQDGTDGVLFDFVRPFAVGKFSFSNSDKASVPGGTGTTVDVSQEIVKTVELLFTDGDGTTFDIAGNFTVDLEDNSIGFTTSGNNTIWLDYSGQNIKLKDLTAYWVMNPATVPIIDLVIITEDYEIRKTIEPASALEFKRNYLNSGTVNLATADATQINLLGTIDPESGIYYIPDANFRAWLSSNITGASDGLTPGEAAAVTSLGLNNKGIADLTGIEWFTNLTGLNCNENNLTSLNVSGLTALTHIYCRENSGLTSLTLPDADATGAYNLQYLGCSQCNLSSLDVSNYTDLQSFNCQLNPNLTTITFGANTGLNIIACYSCKLDGLDLSQVITSQDHSFTMFYCYNNPGDSSGKFNIKLGYNANVEGIPTGLPGSSANTGENKDYWTYNDNSVAVAYTM
jgi:hypothetical protein